MAPRLGEAEERLVREYLQHPTQEARDQIVKFCERFVKDSYRRYLRDLKKILPYDEYLQESVCKIIEVLNRFDPARATSIDPNKNVSFIYWVMLSLDGFAKAIRFRTKRYHRVHQIGKRPPSEKTIWSNDSEVCSPTYDEARKSWAFGSRVDREALDRSILAIQSRHTSVDEIRLLRYIYKRLIECSEFPSFRELVESRFGQVFEPRDLFRLLKYAIREVRLMLYSSCS